MRQAAAAAAARSSADLQLMFPCSPQEHVIATHLLQHQDQELEHHNCKVAKKRWENESEGGRQEEEEEKKKTEVWKMKAVS